jgi:hypothetical protein
VTLLHGDSPQFARAGQIVVNAASPHGIADTSDNPLIGNSVLVILPRAEDLIG